MFIAITDHAVTRYRERVRDCDPDSARQHILQAVKVMTPRYEDGKILYGGGLGLDLRCMREGGTCRVLTVILDEA
jgi:hypothetical protein